MSDWDYEFGTVITIVDNKPVKFDVNARVFSGDSGDLTNKYPIKYYFTDTNDNSKNYIVQVHTSLITMRFKEINKICHKESIKFGLKAIREKYDSDDFLFSEGSNFSTRFLTATPSTTNKPWSANKRKT